MVLLLQLIQFLKNVLRPVSLPHAEQMLYAENKTELALVRVYQSTLEIRMKVAGQNVLSTQTVQLIKHVWETNARTHALEPVVRMQSAKL